MKLSWHLARGTGGPAAAVLTATGASRGRRPAPGIGPPGATAALARAVTVAPGGGPRRLQPGPRLPRPGPEPARAQLGLAPPSRWSARASIRRPLSLTTLSQPPTRSCEHN